MNYSSVYYKQLPKEKVEYYLRNMTFKTKPMLHQMIGLCFAVGRDAIALFYDIGIGKTLTALYINRFVWKAKRILVICPKPVISTWLDEVSLHTDYDITVVDGTKAEKLAKISIVKDGITVMNFEAARSLFLTTEENISGKKSLIFYDGKILSMGFDSIIIDESHHIKNQGAYQTKICWRFGKYILKKIIMTGTPVGDSSLDLWAQIFMLDRGIRLGKSFFGFRFKHFYQYGFKWLPKSLAGQKISSKIEDIALFYDQKECFDLPEIVYEVYVAELKGEQKKAYNYVRGALLSLYEEPPVDIGRAENKINKLRQIVGGFCYGEDIVRFEYGTKKEVLKDLLQSCLKRSKKIIIYHSYREEGRIIEEVCDKVLGIKEYSQYMSFRGEKNYESSFERIKQAKNISDIRIIIASIKSFSEGINFSEATIGIFYSNEFSRTNREQAIGRIYRKGQKKKVLIIDIEMENSVDLYIKKVLRRKEENKKSIIENFIFFEKNKKNV